MQLGLAIATCVWPEDPLTLDLESHALPLHHSVPLSALKDLTIGTDRLEQTDSKNGLVEILGQVCYGVTVLVSVIQSTFVCNVRTGLMVGSEYIIRE